MRHRCSRLQAAGSAQEGTVATPATACHPPPLPLQLICSAFDLMPPGSRKTFPELGRAAAGPAGMRAVFLFCSLELFGATIMLLMIAYQQLELLLPAQGRAWGDGGRGACAGTAAVGLLLFVLLRCPIYLQCSGSSRRKPQAPAPCWLQAWAPWGAPCTWLPASQPSLCCPCCLSSCGGWGRCRARAWQPQGWC